MSQLPNPDDQATVDAPPEPAWQRFDLSTQLDEALSAAEQALAAGRLIVLPTDTVYGIAADALQAEAVQALLDAKRRGRDMPPPVLISEPAMLRALVADAIHAARVRGAELSAANE